MITYLSIIFLIGLLTGSFANVCIYRIPKGLSIIRPGSFCPECGRPIKWFDNIPLVSFIILGGKCRHCGSRISAQYPLVEFTNGILFLLMALRHAYDPAMPYYLLFTLLLVIISGIDYHYKIIPDELSLIIIALSIIYAPFNPVLGEVFKTRLFFSAAGGFGAGAGLFLIGILGKLIFKREAMGGGDVKLIAGIGFLLGPMNALITVLAASLLGSIAGLLLIFSGKIDRKEYIPFGPFLAAGAYFTIVVPELKNLLQ